MKQLLKNVALCIALCSPSLAYCGDSQPCHEQACTQNCTAYLNRVVHFEIYADDPVKAAQFYQTVFGWTIQKWDNPEFDYWLVMTGPCCNTVAGINGGIMKRTGPKPTGQEPVNGYICTIAVPSVDEYSEKIEKAGGKIAVSKMAIPGIGWLCYCIDIDGNVFGIMQDDANAK